GNENDRTAAVEQQPVQVGGVSARRIRIDLAGNDDVRGVGARQGGDGAVAGKALREAELAGKPGFLQPPVEHLPDPGGATLGSLLIDLVEFRRGKGGGSGKRTRERLAMKADQIAGKGLAERNCPIEHALGILRTAQDCQNGLHPDFSLSPARPGTYRYTQNTLELQ